MRLCPKRFLYNNAKNTRSHTEEPENEREIGISLREKWKEPFRGQIKGKTGTLFEISFTLFRTNGKKDLIAHLQYYIRKGVTRRPSGSIVFTNEPFIHFCSVFYLPFTPFLSLLYILFLLLPVLHYYQSKALYHHHWRHMYIVSASHIDKSIRYHCHHYIW